MLQKHSTSLEIELNELKKINKALGSQFDKKNVQLDKLNSLIDNIHFILLSFLGNPSAEEKNCIHEIVKYINNIYKE